MTDPRMNLATVFEDTSRALSQGFAETVSAAELGAMLGITEKTIQDWEQAGMLFSFLRPHRTRRREYPAFQALPGIVGEPLRRVLAALSHPSGSSSYAFFTSPQATLGGLSPIETLLGATRRQVDFDARQFLLESAESRLLAVIAAGETYASELAA